LDRSAAAKITAAATPTATRKPVVCVSPQFDGTAFLMCANVFANRDVSKCQELFLRADFLTRIGASFRQAMTLVALGELSN
jgi:hypothetical protein